MPYHAMPPYPLNLTPPVLALPFLSFLANLLLIQDETDSNGIRYDKLKLNQTKPNQTSHAVDTSHIHSPCVLILFKYQFKYPTPPATQHTTRQVLNHHNREIIFYILSSTFNRKLEKTINLFLRLISARKFEQEIIFRTETAASCLQTIATAVTFAFDRALIDYAVLEVIREFRTLSFPILSLTDPPSYPTLVHSTSQRLRPSHSHYAPHFEGPHHFFFTDPTLLSLNTSTAAPLSCPPLHFYPTRPLHSSPLRILPSQLHTTP